MTAMEEGNYAEKTGDSPVFEAAFDREVTGEEKERARGLSRRMSKLQQRKGFNIAIAPLFDISGPRVWAVLDELAEGDPQKLFAREFIFHSEKTRDPRYALSEEDFATIPEALDTLEKAISQMEKLAEERRL